MLTVVVYSITWLLQAVKSVLKSSLVRHIIILHVVDSMK